ncbi:Oidioi.mRNA.OKI2018_I69.PAR.g10791.t1.cds [Oikopleura dioica]|uniref:Oidioi.mRNA.OKI2018_I69.PAR.g10791.t1.cds n=1 Tax=Oikopleura dioica TaxID=34765 RepID=A0ABN7RWN5_OIKDI|nr:Oidioi.mRNA.OKI2018_I69.PAR.g10791.t1.cds [Oikopleura dioica]
MVAPDFTERLQNVATRQGEPVELSVTVNDNDAVIAWFREGAAIQNGGDFVISSSGNRHTLSITSPYPEDSGVFTVTASNASGKATSTASLFVEAASSDEEYAVHQSTQKSVQKTTVTESSTSVKAVKKSASASSKKIAGFQPSAQQNMFAKVFMSAETGLKKVKKVKKTKVESSAETEYETVAESCTEAECFTETEASSVEQIGSMTKISPQVPRKPTALDLIKKPQIEVSSPLGKKREIQGFRSVKSTTGKIHQISSSKKVDINIDRTSNQQILYGAKFNPGGGVVRHVTAPSGPRSREASEERRTNYATSNYESEFEQVDIDDEEEAGNEELVEVDSLPATPEPEDNAPVEDEPQEPFAPRFEMPPEDVDVIEGDVAILQAHIAAWPEPEIKWYREGALIDNCEDYQVSFEDGIAQLVIRNCYPDDAGKFTISASNQMGTSSSTCLLGVKSTSQCERDQFEQVYEESANESANESGTATSDPDDESVIVKRTDVLSPVHEGAEGLQSPASPVRHHQSPEQVLEEAMEIVTQAEQRLAATSPVAASPVPAALPPASGAPRFSTIPDRCVLLQEGATQIFEAVAPGAHVFWERDGKPIIGGYRVKVEEDEKKCKSTLTLNMVFPEDAGEYVAVAANQFGKSTHSVFFLSSEHYAAFMRKGGEVPTGLTDYTTAESSDELDSRGRRENLKNIKKGVGIKSGGTPLGTRSPSPRLRSMSGSPKRAASPGQGRLSTLDPADMSKVYKPVFLVKAVNQEITEGKATRINIRVTGRPPAQITWLKNGEPVQEDDTHRIIIKENGVESLIFDSVTEADSGEYTVVAANVGGKAVSNAKITVLPSEEAQRPQILEKPVSTKVNAGESVRLAVFAVGRPTPDICWLKDNQLLIPEKHTNYQFEGVDGHGLLTIDAATKAHDGWYTATAINRAGRDLCRCKITVSADEKKQDAATGRKFQSSRKGLKKKADASPGRHTGKLTQAPEDFDEADLFDKSKKQKPVFKKKISNIKTKTLGEATFECRVTPIGDPTMKVQWLLEGKPLENANRIQTMFEFGYTSLTVTHCYPRDTGVITCRVTNAHGAAESSATLIVKEDRGTTFAAAEGRAMQLIAEREKNSRADSESPPYARSPTKGDDDAQFAPQIVSIPDDCKTNEGQPMRFKVRCTGNPQPKVEWYLNGQQIRKSKRFTLWNDGLHHLEINPARAYDTGSLVAVAINKIGQAQASCCVDVEPLGDLRSNLKRVDSSSPDSALRAMRIDRKVDTEKRTAELGEYKKSKRMSSSVSDANLNNSDVSLLEYFQQDLQLAGKSQNKNQNHVEVLSGNTSLLSDSLETESMTSSTTPIPGSHDFYEVIQPKKNLNTKTSKAKAAFTGAAVTTNKWKYEQELFTARQKLKPAKITRTASPSLTLEEVQLRRTSMNASPTKSRPSAAYDPELREKFHKVKTEEHQMTAARVTVQKKPDHFDQKDQEELLKKTKRELEHWETPEETPSPMGQPDLPSHALQVEIPDFSDIKAKDTENDLFQPPVITEKLKDIKFDSDTDATIRVRFFGSPMPELQWFHNGVELSMDTRRYWKFVDNSTCELYIFKVNAQDEGQYAARVSNRGGEELSTCIVTVNEIKRKILEGPRSQEWSSDMTARFEIVVSHKDVEGIWMKDGVEIAVSDKHFVEDIGGGRRRLTIQNLKKVDEGIYEYVYAGDRAAATLTVNQAKLEISEQLRDQSVLAGEVVTFDCLLTDETSDGKWFKDGEEIQVSDRLLAIAENQRQMLIIEDATEEDIGVYSFVVDGAQTSASLAIQDAVRIVQGLQPSEAVEGEQAVLAVVIEPESYTNGKWMKNGAELQFDSRMSYAQPQGGFKELVIRNVNSNDAGVYAFVAGNQVTECEFGIVEINVLEPLRDQQVELSGEVLFETLLSHVNVVGTWCKNDVPIKMEDERVQVFIDEKVQALYLNNVVPEDAGVYSFSAGGKSTACELLVAVPTPNVEFKHGLQDVQVKNKENVVFQIELTADVPGAWFKDGQPIADSDRVKSITEGVVRSLIIAEAGPEDEGVYTYACQNIQSSANLFVEVAYIIPKNFKDTSVAEGETAVFECEVTKSDLETHWFRDGVEIDVSDDKYEIIVQGLSYKLLIHNCTVRDKCEIVFLAADESVAANLQVNAAEIMEDAVDCVQNEGEDATFSVTTTSNATVFWTRDNVRIKPNAKYQSRMEGKKSFLTIKNVCVEDAGSYTCHVGSTESTAVLFVEVAEVKFVSSTNIEVAASLDKNYAEIEFQVNKEGAEGNWFHNGIQVNIEEAKYNYVVDRTYHKLIVKELDINDSGEYSFKTGTQVATAFLNVQAKEEPASFVRELSDAGADLSEDAEFYVEVAGVPTPVVTFYKQGTQIMPSGKHEIIQEGNVVKLIVNCCTEADVSQYSATAKNSTGTVMCKANLNIVEKKSWEQEEEQVQEPAPEQQSLAEMVLFSPRITPQKSKFPFLYSSGSESDSSRPASGRKNRNPNEEMIQKLLAIKERLEDTSDLEISESAMRVLQERGSRRGSTKSSTKSSPRSSASEGAKPDLPKAQPASSNETKRKAETISTNFTIPKLQPKAKPVEQKSEGTKVVKLTKKRSSPVPPKQEQNAQKEVAAKGPTKGMNAVSAGGKLFLTEKPKHRKTPDFEKPKISLVKLARAPMWPQTSIPPRSTSSP